MEVLLYVDCTNSNCVIIGIIVYLFEHKVGKSGPGSIWNPNNTNLFLSSRKTTAPSLLTDNHYHVFIKYGYAKAVINGYSAEQHYWKKIYTKMQTKRIGYSKCQHFDTLIKSFEKVGYDYSYPIPLDKRQNILDGSHRLAIALALNILPSVETYNCLSHVYNRQWFVEHGFSKTELSRCDALKGFLQQKHTINLLYSKIVLIWDLGFDKSDKIIEMLTDQNNVYILWLDLLTDKIKRDFVFDIYKGAEMDETKNIQKATLLASRDTIVGVCVIDNGNALAFGTNDIIGDSLESYTNSYLPDTILQVIDSPKAAISLLRTFSDVSSRLILNQFDLLK